MSIQNSVAFFPSENFKSFPDPPNFFMPAPSRVMGKGIYNTYFPPLPGAWESPFHSATLTFGKRGECLEDPGVPRGKLAVGNVGFNLWDK
jgi:hypothetical protein